MHNDCFLPTPYILVITAILFNQPAFICAQVPSVVANKPADLATHIYITPSPTPGPYGGLPLPAENEQQTKQQVYPKRIFKDGKIIPYPTPGPEPRSAIYGMPNVEGQKQIDSDIKAYNDKHGASIRIFATAAPSQPDELVYYEIPDAYIISGCVYVNGYSFPDACTDDDGHEIFRSGKDPQSKLDEIRVARGVSASDNNIVPPSYTGSPEVEPEPHAMQEKVKVLKELNTSHIVDTGQGL